MKISLKKILIFMFLKYFVFYAFMMFKTSNYALIEFENLISFVNIFYYLWIFLFLPTVCFVLFSFPIYYSFSKNNVNVFMLINIGVLIIEYAVYTCLASQSDYLNGIFNSIISVICFLFIFRKEIKRYKITSTP